MKINHSLLYNVSDWRVSRLAFALAFFSNPHKQKIECERDKIVRAKALYGLWVNTLARALYERCRFEYLMSIFKTHLAIKNSVLTLKKGRSKFKGFKYKNVFLNTNEHVETISLHCGQKVTWFSMETEVLSEFTNFWSSWPTMTKYATQTLTPNFWHSTICSCYLIVFWSEWHGLVWKQLFYPITSLIPALYHI